MEGEWSLEEWLSESQFPDDIFSHNPLSTWSVFPEDLPTPVDEPKSLRELIAPAIAHESGKPDDDLPLRVSEEIEHRQPVPAEARCEMNQWIMSHTSHPFLSNKDEEYFMGKYGLTRRQVRTAFNNRRQRIIAPSRRRMEAVQRLIQQQAMTQLTALGVPVSSWLPWAK
jgi:hypothetical protein